MEKKYSEKQLETIKLLKSAVSEESKKASVKKIDMSLEKPRYNRINYQVKGVEKISKFNNHILQNFNDKILLNEDVKTNLRISNYFKNESDNFANFKKNILINESLDENIYIKFNLDENNPHLVDVINLEINENLKANVYIQYFSDKKKQYYHNGYIHIKANKGSLLNIYVIQNINLESENFLGVDLDVLEEATINLYNVEFGAKTNIVSVNTNLLGDKSNCLLAPIYLADFDRKVDLEYTLNFFKKYSKADIDAKGVTKDKAVKVFRGNLVFERYSTKSEGSESEFSIILDKSVNAHSIPTLFCDEDDVIGAHSASIGKIDEDKLFYLMSRGFNQKEAKKLVIESSFSTVFDAIKDEEILERIKKELEGRI